MMSLLAWATPSSNGIDSPCPACSISTTMVAGFSFFSLHVNRPSPWLTISPVEASLTTIWPRAREYISPSTQKNAPKLGILASPMIERVSTSDSGSLASATCRQMDDTRPEWRGAAGCMTTRLLGPASTTQEPGM